MDFYVLVKKKKRNDNKYLDLARGRRKLWNTKVKVIPIIVGTLGTINRGREKGQRNSKSI